MRKIPLKVYIFLSLLTVGTMGFSNASLGHLNYPTQVIFKCCKLIPVLVGSSLIQGKKYTPLDYLAALFMCIGLIFFILADSKLSPIFDTIGLAMISAALLFDALIGNVQEKEMKKHNASNAEIVFYSYFIGIFYILFYLIASGDFVPAFRVCLENKVKTYGYGFVFSLTGYIGIQIVLQLVRTGGAFAAVTVTTCRKAVSIVISFLVFSKPFTSQYVYSGLLVVLGIYLNLYSKKNPDTSLVQAWNSLLQRLQVHPHKVPHKRFVEDV
jgi:adenosine 3'-phospho 5'-phosphosulfate transporter B3